MFVSSPGGTTCGPGMDRQGQVLTVWKHEDLKPCCKIIQPLKRQHKRMKVLADQEDVMILGIVKLHNGLSSDPDGNGVMFRSLDGEC